jgi:hypothetical protein
MAGGGFYMINEDKVRIMTKCAIYEQGKGRRELPLAGFFKSDYVRFHILKTMVAVVFAYILIVGIVVLLSYDELFAQLNQLHFKWLIVIAVGGLLVLLAVYYAIARHLYVARFERVRKRVAAYYRNLKQLKAFYSAEQKTQREREERRPAAENDEFIDY